MFIYGVKLISREKIPQKSYLIVSKPSELIVRRRGRGEKGEIREGRGRI